MLTIVVFRARDGLYAYCPAHCRHWRVFDYTGTFQTEAEAVAAAKADRTIPARYNLVVEK